MNIRYASYAKQTYPVAVIVGGLLFSTAACNSIARYGMYNDQSIQATSTKQEGTNLSSTFKDENKGFPLHEAILDGRVEMVSAFLNAKNISVNERDSCGRTPLHEAVLHGRVEIVNALLSRERHSG